MKTLMENWRLFKEENEQNIILFPDWLKEKLQDVHGKPGQGSVFAISIDEVEKIVKDILSKRNDVKEVANTTGTIEEIVPGVGYNLVLPKEEAMKLPNAKLSSTEKIEGPNKIKVPMVTTSDPMSNFVSDNLTIIVRPMKDESGNIKPNEFIILSAFPGDPSIPRASEWNDQYAVVMPEVKSLQKNDDLQEKKKMSNKNMKTILNEWRNYKKLTEDLEKIGTGEPVPLSKISADVGREAVVSGKKDGMDDDDKAKGSFATLPVAELNPMQKEVIAAKALAFALGYLRDGKPQLEDMEAIVAVDNGKNYIMDGHHRWAARTLIDPTAKVKVTLIQGATATEVITALNLWTKSQDRSGNAGEGDVTKFASSIPQLLDAALAKGTKDGLGQWPHLSPEEVKQSLAKVPGAKENFEKGKDIMIANSKKLPTQKHPKAPLRVDMPVVKDQGEINKVVNLITNGEIDFRLPLSQQLKTAISNQLKTAANKDAGEASADSFASTKK